MQKNNDKKVLLVTGGAGFIGSTFVNMLSLRYPNYRFVVLDALTDVADKRNLTVLTKSNVSFVKCDIRNAKALRNVFAARRPTDVIHFAAETHVDVSIQKPQLFIETNVLGTGNLLSLAHAYRVNRFHHISTDEVCGALSLADAPLSESAPLLPNNPYSASKAGAESLVRAYGKTFGLDTVITRSSNTYGPRQDTSKFIPLFISRFLSNKKAPLYGDGRHMRDWLYVEDHVEALDLVFHKGKSGEIYNIGGVREIRNIDVAHILLRAFGKSETLIQHVTGRPGHDLRYALDISKIEKEFGWRPATQFEDGIARTIEFYREKIGQRTRPKKR